LSAAFCQMTRRGQVQILEGGVGGSCGITQLLGALPHKDFARPELHLRVTPLVAGKTEGDQTGGPVRRPVHGSFLSDWFWE
jgi:hypothetical protein